MIILTPRPHQHKLSADLLGILKSSSHAYLESPTGTGKTLVVALTGEAANVSTKIFLAHSVDIASQLNDDFDDFAAMGIVKDRNAWLIMTWHAFREAYQADRLPALLNGQTADLVFVDECHIGGSARNEEKVSFPIIKTVASRVVWVSATPWDIDERVLGERRGHTAILSVADAYAQGLINNTELIRVDCGLKLRAAVNELELTDKRAFHHLAGQVFETEGYDIEETFDGLNEDLSDVLNRRLRPGDVRRISRHVTRLMADAYLAENTGEKAIFWLSNQRLARECAAYIQARLPNGQRAEPIVTEVGGSTAEAEYTTKSRDSFADPDGEVRVACVVYRLREGFDAPHLALGYDCCWNPHNLKYTVQKIGRLIRTSPGKPCSRYYYAVSVKTIASAYGQDINEEFVTGISNSLGAGYDTARFTAEATIEHATIYSKMNGKRHTTSPFTREYGFSSETQPFHGTRTPLFNFESAEGFNRISSLDLTEIVTDKLGGPRQLDRKWADLR